MTVFIIEYGLPAPHHKHHVVPSARALGAVVHAIAIEHPELLHTVRLSYDDQAPEDAA